MNQFFVNPENILSDRIIIDGNDYNHIKNVLRMRPGQELSVYNGLDNREYRCIIDTIGEENIVCNIEFVKDAAVELPVSVTVFQGYPKGDKLELIVQKAVELGVGAIVPVLMERSVVKLDLARDKEKIKKKNDRLQSISEAASKQAKRAYVPSVEEPMDFKGAVSMIKDFDHCIVPYELAKDKGSGMQVTRSILKSLKPGEKICIFIGPEGGFSTGEIDELKKAGGNIISLGKRILRTETAGLALLSFMIYELEDR